MRKLKRKRWSKSTTAQRCCNWGQAAWVQFSVALLKSCMAPASDFSSLSLSSGSCVVRWVPGLTLRVPEAPTRDFRQAWCPAHNAIMDCTHEFFLVSKEQTTKRLERRFYCSFDMVYLFKYHFFKRWNVCFHIWAIYSIYKFQISVFSYSKKLCHASSCNFYFLMSLHSKGALLSSFTERCILVLVCPKRHLCGVKLAHTHLIRVSYVLL